MKRLVAVAMALACGITAVLADTDPIAERRALMKHDGEAAKKLFDMSKGKAPFDLADGEGIAEDARRRRDENGDAVSRQQQDRRRHRGAARDLGEQGGLRRPLRPIRQGCPGRSGRNYG